MPSVPERPSSAELRARLDEHEVAHAMDALARLLWAAAEDQAREQAAESDTEGER